MRILSLSFGLVALLVAPLVARAEDAPAKPERRVDPAAMALIEGARKKVYLLGEAGLHDFTCDASVQIPGAPAEMVYTVKYVKGGTSEVALKGGGMDPGLKQMIQGLLIDRINHEGFMDAEKYNVEMKEGSKDTVVLTKYAPDADSDRQVITFGENGLPTKIEGTTRGQTSTVSFKYEEKDGKFVWSGGEVDAMGQVFTMATTYEKVGKYWLINKITMTMMMGEMKITCSNYKVDQTATTESDK